MSEIKTMTLPEFQAACQAQAPEPQDIVFKCPMCETLQNGRDLIKAGAGDDFDDVSGFVGFSCIGRFTGKGRPGVERGKGHGCNWTLGGLFRTHKMEIVTPDGDRFPHFEIASMAEAEAHRAKQAEVQS